MRGRNRPKGPNPLTRSYESNGPDVKIRGTAQHIADKYAQLARDALASGDPIAAENYFQHGEHYFRIITSAQDQTRQAAGQGYARQGYDDEDEGDDEGQGPSQGFAAQNGDQGRQGYGSDDYNDPAQLPQPYERHDFENRQGRDRQDQGRDRQDRNDRPDRRERFQNRGERPQRFEGNRQDYGRGEPRQDQRPDYGARQDRGRQDYGRQDYGRQENRPEGRPEGRHEPRHEARYDTGRGEQVSQDEDRGEEVVPRRDRRRDEGARAEEAPGLPAFLMTATRNPAPPEPVAEAPSAPGSDAPSVAAGEEESAPIRKPRRRRTRYKSEDGQEATHEAPAPADAPAGE